MSTWDQIWLWIGTIAMLLGGAAILAIGKRRTAAEEGDTIYHGIVPIIAAFSYFAMASGVGATIIPHGTLVAATSDTTAVAAPLGRLFYYARYVDWLFTTPLLLLSLAYAGMHSGLRRGGLIAGLLLSDVLMIVAAFLFGAIDITWMKWTWFLISCIAFLPIYYVMWGPLLEQSRLETPAAQANYRRNATLLSVLWGLYPLLLALSTDGLGVFGSATGVALIMVLDVTSKVVYGLLATVSMGKIVNNEEAAGLTATKRPVARAA